MIGFTGGLEFGGAGMVDGSSEVREDIAAESWEDKVFCVVLTSTVDGSSEVRPDIAAETWEDKVFCVLLPFGFISIAAENGEEEFGGMCWDWGC